MNNFIGINNYFEFLEFWTFVVNQETWRKKFLELEKSASELSAHLKEAEQEKLTLQTKLKHARLT